MIEKASHWIAVRIKEANPSETTTVEIMRFSLIILINGLSILFLSSIIGLITNSLADTITIFVIMCILRFLSGGYHLNTPGSCIALSTVVVSVIPHVHFSSMLAIIFTAVSLLLVLVFAPAGLEGHTRVPKSYYPAFKVVSALIVLTNFWFQSDIISVAFIVQAVSLVPFRKGGE